MLKKKGNKKFQLEKRDSNDGSAAPSINTPFSNERRRISQYMTSHSVEKKNIPQFSTHTLLSLGFYAVGGNHT
jgi:hypothetical protein